MLVGVGGSGRQSLSRLAAKISDYNIYQIDIKKNYKMPEWREDMKTMLMETGANVKTTVFLFTDN